MPNRLKISKTMKMTSGDKDGYGFNFFTSNGRIISLMFKTTEDSEKAAEQLQTILDISINVHGQ